MTEVIILFHKDDLQKAVLADRDEVYANRRETYQDYYIHVIDMFIFNKYGEVLVQKRSKRKKNMPGLYHSSVGGHINDGDSPQLTLIKECLEEVGVPCILVEDKEEFQHVYEQIGEYTSSFVLACAHEMMEHIIDTEVDRAGRAVHIQDIIYMCFGLYDGPLQNIDRSADGFEWFTLDDLKIALETAPNAFTPSYPFLFEKLEGQMRMFVERYCRGG